MDDAQTLLSVSYIILLILEGHFCPLPLPAKGKGGSCPSCPNSSSVPANNYSQNNILLLPELTVCIAFGCIVNPHIVCKIDDTCATNS